MKDVWAIVAVALTILFSLDDAWAQSDFQTGVGPSAINVPDGPGSLMGLGQQFIPRLNMGSGVFKIDLRIPPQRGQSRPDPILFYDTGFGNGPFGIGWRLELPQIRRRTSNGMPEYGGADIFVTENGEELVPIADDHSKTIFRKRIESDFSRFTFHKSDKFWTIETSDGSTFYLGNLKPDLGGAAARIEANGRIYAWLPSAIRDANGNRTLFRYETISNTPEIVLREIRYNITAVSNVSVHLSYKGRPDALDDYRSGFRLPLSQLCYAIRVESDGEPVVEYSLRYTQPNGLSVLTDVVEVGWDGATSLPALKLEYTGTAASRKIQRFSQAPPTQAFAAGDAQFIDMDGDALPDILETKREIHVWYRNRGDFNFSGGVSLPNNPRVLLSSGEVRLSDLDGDVRADFVIRRRGGTEFVYHRMSASGSWEQTPVRSAAANYGFDFSDPNVRTADLNNDRRLDLMMTPAVGDFVYWLNTGLTDTGEQTWERRTGPRIGGLTFREGLRLADMNGDGLVDLVQVRQNSVDYWPSMGYGKWGTRHKTANSPPLGAGAPDAQLTDIDRNGLSDILLVKSGYISYWLNQGNKFGVRVDIKGMPALGPNMRTKFLDINGNGSSDVVWIRLPGDGPTGIMFLDLAPQRPNLLSKIDNSLGFVTEVSYISAAKLSADEAVAGNAWRSLLPLPVTVVASTREKRLVSGDWSETSYTYRDGAYDRDEREFAGFASVSAYAPSDQSVAAQKINYRFHTGTQSRWLRGKPTKTTVMRESGDVISEQIQSWYVRALGVGENGHRTAFPALRHIDTYILEGGTSGPCIRTEFDYDDHGNVIAERRFGLVGNNGDNALGSDERITTRSFAKPKQDGNWHFDKISEEIIHDLHGKIISRTRHYYDGLPLGNIARGNLTKREQWSDKDATFKVLLKQQFDTHGNVLETVNGRGEKRTIEFEKRQHTYPSKETIHLTDRNLFVSASYDLRVGQPTTVTSFGIEGKTTGEKTLIKYDALGRLSAIVRPEDTVKHPTIVYNYFYDSGGSYVETRRRFRSGEALVGRSRDIYNGAGDLIASAVQEKDGSWVVSGKQDLNRRGETYRLWRPFKVSASADILAPPKTQPTQIFYDADGREIERVEPDGTTSSIKYEPLLRHISDFNDHASSTGRVPPHGDYRSVEFDGLGRIIQVTERLDGKPLKTSYSYDPLDRLTALTNSEQETRRFQFDSLGNMIFQSGPGFGNRHYEHDLAGNVTLVRDALGDELTYEYDSASRIKSVRFRKVSGSGSHVPRVIAAYEYDKAPDNSACSAYDAINWSGRLAQITDEHGDLAIGYDIRGNRICEDRSIVGPLGGKSRSYVVKQTFDAQDRLLTRAFPDNDTLVYQYNNRDFLDSVKRITGDSLVDHVTYAADGRISGVRYGNGTSMERHYDTRGRLIDQAVLSQGGTDVIYRQVSTYDSNGNVLTQNEQQTLPSGEQLSHISRLRYDSLDRLIDFNLETQNGGSPVSRIIKYQYTPSGELIEKVIASDGTIVSPPTVLDANGNVTELGQRILKWDRPSKLTSVNGPGVKEEYAYDADGRRLVTTTKTSSGQMIRDEPFIYLANESGVLFKTVYLGDNIAVRYSDNSGGPLYFVAAVNRSLRLATKQSGAIAGVYTYDPFGMPLNATATRLGTLGDRTFTGKEWRPSVELYDFGARFYDPLRMQFLSPDPLLENIHRLRSKRSIEEWEALLSDPQRWNLYAYGRLNPIRFYDPNGQEPIDTFQLVLDGVGLVPVVGEVADLTNAAIYLGRGRYTDATLSVVSAVPFIGWGGTVGKVGINAKRGLGAVGATKSLAGLSRGQAKTVLKTAQETYKGSTRVGHALSKHAGRNPDIWGKISGSPKSWNDQAMKHAREIFRGPGEFQKATNAKGITFIEKRLNDGRGIRLNQDYTFKGFID